MRPLPRGSTTATRLQVALAALMLVFALGQGSLAGQAAPARISGKVIDASSGAPMSDVQIFLAGAQLGSLSRANGIYLIPNVPAGNYEVRAERIGYTPGSQTVTVAAGQAVEINFSLSQAALGLDEIIVTGTAGASRRREVGNSVAQINTADLPVRPVNAGELLSAAAPGVEVTLGGETGMGTRIRLRGQNSINNDNPPIIYIDGIRMQNQAFERTASKDQNNRFSNVNSTALDMINPNDIDRIEIIKGSAATTLYGTEASGGVIQVFTKKGSQGAPVWTVESQVGTQWSQRYGVGNIPNTLPDGTPIGGSSKYLWMDNWSCTGIFKCGEFMPGPALTQVYSGSVRGGGQTLQYFSSGDYTTEQGNTIQDHLDRWALRGNFTFSPFSDLLIQLNNGYSNQAQTNSPTGNNAEGLQLNVFRQNQNYAANNDPAIINQLLTQENTQQAERFTTGGTINYTPLENLTNRFTVGYDFSSQENRNLRPFGFPTHPEGTILNSTFHRRLLTFDYVGTYSFDLVSSLRSSFSWGGQTVGNETRRVEGYGWGFPGAAVPTVNSASATLGYEERSKTWNAGFFLQDVLSLKDRYFLTLGMRVDGNSAFGKSFGLQAYPKASASWVISDETFWPEAFGTVKLRSAYGKAGRAPGTFDAIRTWQNQGIAGEPAFVPQNVGNADLGPEVTQETEFGADAEWFEGRLSSTFSYYRQITSDAIQGRVQIPSNGFTANQQVNVGKVRNSGTEVSVNVSPIRSANVGWDLGVNWSHNSNEVLAWIDREDLVGRPVSYSTWTELLNGDVVMTQAMADQGRATHQGNGGYSALSCTVAGPVDPATGVATQIPRAALQPGDPCTQSSTILHGYPQTLPPTIISGNTTIRLPHSISLSARGEFRGGNWASINPISISRSVRSPACVPYYANNENVLMKEDAPTVWVHRCTPAIGNAYNAPGDYFKIRQVTATVPVDFLFPERFSNAMLTLSMNNAWTWKKDGIFGTYGIESSGNNGAGDSGNGLGGTERTPPPTTLRVSLRVTF
jgi:TonB-dependent starch-binding outer membrane protein SusC